MNHIYRFLIPFGIGFFFLTRLLGADLPITLIVPPDLHPRQVSLTVRWQGQAPTPDIPCYYDNWELKQVNDSTFQSLIQLPDNGQIHYFYSLFFQNKENPGVTPLQSTPLARRDFIRDKLDSNKINFTENLTPVFRPEYLSFQHDPSHTMTISWETETPGNSIVEYGLDSTYGTVVEESEPTNYHSIELTGLAPNTRYHYRVSSTGIYQSPDRTFKTAPASPEVPFTFVVSGDSRSNDDARRRVKNIIRDIQPDFTLSTGDLVYDGTKQNLWDIWFTTMADLLDRVPFISAIGNHERNSSNYYQLFYLPNHTGTTGINATGEDYYSFNYGSAHFIFLNSEDVGGPGNDQYDWLAMDLQNTQNSPDILWRIIVFHRPAYSSGSHGSNQQIQQYWVPLFEQYNVDLVFAGHDHDYERTIPINNVIYIVTGGAGAPLRSVGSHNWTAYSRSIYHACKLQITHSTLYFEAVDTTGNIFDSFHIAITPTHLKFVDYGIKKFRLMQNYPNPFNGSTVITYQNSEPANTVYLNIYDLLGKQVWSRQFENQPAGTYSVIWDGHDNEGNPLASGIYLYELRTNRFQQIKKLMLIQ